MSQLKKRLKIVWANSPPKRYLPLSLDGGAGWGVFDKREDRFLRDSEVKKIPTDILLTENFAQ